MLLSTAATSIHGDQERARSRRLTTCRFSLDSSWFAPSVIHGCADHAHACNFRMKSTRLAAAELDAGQADAIGLPLTRLSAAEGASRRHPGWAWSMDDRPPA